MELNRKLIGLRCMRCGKLHAADTIRYYCSDCGNNLDAEFDYDFIKHQWKKSDLVQNTDQSIWRYTPLLPVAEPPAQRSILVGNTPLVNVRGLADKYGVKQLMVKDDTRNPSGSLKDRASEVGLRHAAEMGSDVIIAASTGNAAASLSCLAAYHGQKAVIVAPASAPKAKLTQILQYGATLCPIDGNYDAAFDLVTEIVEEFGWYSRNTGQNPVLSEGKKTVALEIAEQLNWDVPDVIFVPVGDGCIIGGVYKGFHDLHQLGWTDRVPRIIAVQAEGSAAIVKAFKSDKPIAAVVAQTIADSISVDLPRDGLKALRAMKASSGDGITVSDDAILLAQKELSAGSGVFTEPAAAAAFAGFLEAVSKRSIAKSDRVVILATGSGLKDIPAAQRRLVFHAPVQPNLGKFKLFIKDSPI